MKTNLDTIVDELAQGDRDLVRVKGSWGGAKLPKGPDNDIVVTIHLTNTKANQHTLADLQQGDNINLIGYFSDEQMEIPDDEGPGEEENPDQGELPDGEDEE
jgi:hypothetical protein